MKEKISILLPVLTITVLFVLFARPQMTGFLVGPESVVSADIKITTAGGVILPADSLVTVTLGEEASSMPISLFIQKSGGTFEFVRGSVPELGYEGWGYTGNHTYIVPLSEFNMTRAVGPGEHSIGVKIEYSGHLISSTEEKVLV